MSWQPSYSPIRKISLPLFLCMLFTLLGCGGKWGDEQLAGQWHWAYTKGHEKGNAYEVTPKSMDMKLSYVFRGDSVLIFIDGATHEAFSFYRSGDTLRYGQEEVLFSISKGKDSLILRNMDCCDDVFEKAFVKRSEKQ